MLIPGELISILTFPGVIIHEFAHKICCEKLGVPIYDVCYFRFGNPAGYVIHGNVNGYGKELIIDVAPFIINSLTAFVIFFFALKILSGFGYLNLFLYWLGFSIAMNSFPSNEDANNLWNHSKRIWREKPLALIGFPIVVFIKVANLLSVIWFDFFYAVVLFVFAGG